jgi:hypothetical protein
MGQNTCRKTYSHLIVEVAFGILIRKAANIGGGYSVELAQSWQKNMNEKICGTLLSEIGFLRQL